MHDFGKFCYLDVEKTGSCFISEFLNRHVSIPQVHFGKHERLKKPKLFGKPNKFFFISARDPIEQMLSLYYYSATKQGAMHFQLSGWHFDCDKLYDGTVESFCHWVELVYNPKLAVVFGENYHIPKSHAKDLYGLMTHRFLMLSFYQPILKVRGIQTKDQLRQLYAEKKVHKAIIRTESLKEDLAQLIEQRLYPYFYSPDEAITALRNAQMLNATPRRGAVNSSNIPNHIAELIREKEWFMLEVLASLQATH